MSCHPGPGDTLHPAETKVTKVFFNLSQKISLKAQIRDVSDIVSDIVSIITKKLV